MAEQFNNGTWHAAGYSVYSTVPQDVDHTRFRGFDRPEGGEGYLIAESIPHKQTRDLIAAAPRLYDACERAEIWLGTVPDSQKIVAILREALLLARDGAK